MARIPKLDAAGKFLAADVNAQIDARAKAATAPLLDGKRGVEATELGTEHLDTVTTPGTYTQSANLEATLETGYPVTRGGVLQVERSVSKTMVWQTYTTYAPTASTPPQTWQRGSYNGTWTPWARVGGGVDGSVPIFPTLAEAQAWEAANPGKKALTLEPSTPDTTAPTPGVLSVTKTHNSAQLSVSGATDDRAVTGYAFSKDGGTTYTAWQASSSYTYTGLTVSTPYDFRHKVRDAAGNERVGAIVSVATDAAPAHPYITAAKSMDLDFILPLDGNTLNVGTDTRALRIIPAPAYNTATPMGGFSSTISTGNVWIDNYVAAGAPAFTTAVIWRYTDASTANAYKGAVNSAMATVNGAINNPWQLQYHPSKSLTVPTSSLPALTVGQTYHVAYTWDGATSKLYVDGVLRHSIANAEPAVAVANVPARPSGEVNGFILDATKALTAEQIKTLSDAVTR